MPFRSSLADGLHPVPGMNRFDFEAKNHRIWVLLAHRSGAKLYSASSHESQLQLIQEISFPEGRRQNREITSDAEGQRYNAPAASTISAGGGSAAGPSRHQQKHGLDPNTEAVEHLADVFAHDVCNVLHAGRTHDKFDELILVAEPSFLGKLHHFLDARTTDRVVASLNQNWIDLPKKLLQEKLSTIIRTHFTRAA